MQKCFSNHTKLALVVVMALGGFVVNAHASVHAATMAITHDTGQENTGCYKQGCAQEHGSCQKRCLQQTPDHLTVGALASSHHDFSLLDVPQQDRLVDHPVQEDIFVATSDRAPPTHRLLRSVMKRE
jgi:hypothetical protein